MTEIRIRKDHNFEKLMKTIPYNDWYDFDFFNKRIHKKNNEFVRKTSNHLLELIIEDLNGNFIDKLNLFYNKIEFKSIKNNKKKICKINFLSFKIKDIFKFAYHLYAKKENKPWYTNEELLLVKRLMDIESDKDSEMLGIDNYYDFISMKPNKIVRDNYSNFANSMVCYHLIYSHDYLDNQLKKFTSEKYLRVFIDYYLHSGNLSMQVFKKEIIKFKEPKSLKECLELDLTSRKEDNKFLNVKYHNIRCLRDITNRKLGQKKLLYLQDHYSYIISSYSNYKEVIDKIPIFAFKNLYFTDWYHGLGNEIYESYQFKRCLLTFQNVKYMNQKRIDSDKSIYENSYLENFLGSYYHYYEKYDDHKEFNRELNFINRNIKNGNRFWEED